MITVFTPWHRCLIALIGIGALALALLGGAGALSNTDAAWVDEEQATASFTAGTLGPVQNLECRQGATLLGLSLLENQLELSWTRPRGLPQNVPIVYEISAGSRVVGEVHETSYVYTARPAILDLQVTLSVVARVGSWTGPGNQYRASQLLLLGLPVRVACEKLLGVL
ncbi:hypothetical protein ES5_07991 [Dietzia cinnamea P4]|nr:hypothetical protein ES5_07991 [Dietzia cinnamea P4]